MPRKPSPPRRTKSAARKAAGGPPSASSAAWDQLQAKHPDHPALAAESIYSLPPKLVEAIHHEIPKLFTDADLAFEQDLAELAPSGFVERMPFGYPPLLPPSANDRPSDDLVHTAKQTAASLRELLAEDMRNRGMANDAIDHYFAYQHDQRQQIEVRRWSYAGWVATSRKFQQERDELREHFLEMSLPSLPISLIDADDTDSEDYCTLSARMFLQRWGLEALATWDLPIPLRPELTEPALYPTVAFGDAGLHLFIPWYLVRDKDIRLYDVAEHNRLVTMPAPLNDWLDFQEKYWGHKRNTTMLRLFVYLELALRRRYAAQLRRQAARLDHAFSRFLLAEGDQDETMREESLRKIRLAMLKRLSMDS
jgi:hypothetical protein